MRLDDAHQYDLVRHGLIDSGYSMVDKREHQLDSKDRTRS